MQMPTIPPGLKACDYTAESTSFGSFYKDGTVPLETVVPPGTKWTGIDYGLGIQASKSKDGLKEHGNMPNDSFLAPLKPGTYCTLPAHNKDGRSLEASMSRGLTFPPTASEFYRGVPFIPSNTFITTFSHPSTIAQGAPGRLHKATETASNY